MKTRIYLLVGLFVLFVLAGCATAPTGDSGIDLPPAIQKYNEQMSAKEIPKDASVRQATLAIKDMTCPSCALGVEYQIKQLDGVYDAEIKYPEGIGLVTYDSTKLDAENIAKASTIYEATVASDDPYNQGVRP